MPEQQDVSYDSEAVRLVLAGLRDIRTKFDHAKERGLFPKGRHITEMIRDDSWSPPALMDEQRLAEFTQLTHGTTPDDVLRAIWYIMENIADEPRLMPALVLNRETGCAEVRLTL